MAIFTKLIGGWEHREFIRSSSEKAAHKYNWRWSLAATTVLLSSISFAQVDCPNLFANTPEVRKGSADGTEVAKLSVPHPCLMGSLAGLSGGSSDSAGTETLHDSLNVASALLPLRLPAEPIISTRVRPPERFQWRGALLQSFEFLMLQHAFRFANDPSLRYQIAHGPFFHNWFASYGGYDLKRWSDGDSFLVNGIGHPLQGAVASRIFLQNSPKGSARIGKNPQYWIGRLKGMAWAAAFEVQWKIGPLSETSLGNAGGWLYVPSCGFSTVCLNNPKYRKPPTNNTGLSDWILTPVVGTGWVMLEDAIDKYLVARIAVRHPLFGGKILRTALEPSRSFAGLFMGKLPWEWPAPESYVIKPNAKPALTAGLGTESGWKINRQSFGVHYINVNLPGTREDCVGCRSNNAGAGITYGYRAFRNVFFDSELNYFPSGASNGGPTMQGLFGAKFGRQGKTWGVFGKLRPGFIYYENAWTGGQDAKWDDLSRFALDAGGVVEVYPSKRSTFRFDIGTTLVRYLRDYPNAHLSELGTLQSRDYYVNQGNFQLSSGYTIRF